MIEKSVHYRSDDSENASQIIKLSRTRRALAVASFLDVAILIIAFLCVNDHPNTGLALIGVFIFLGLCIFIGVVETTVLANLVNLRGLLIAWATLITFLTFIAKAQAVAEINKIFHTDASIFPMTLFAVTALRVAIILYFPVIISTVILILVIWFGRQNFFQTKDGALVLIAVVVSAVAQGFFLIIFWGWSSSEEKRGMLIYRVANYADFNSYHRCREASQEKGDRIVFIDTNRTRILIAPIPIEPLYWGENEKPLWLRPIIVPDEFEQNSCTPYTPAPHI